MKKIGCVFLFLLFCGFCFAQAPYVKDLNLESPPNPVPVSNAAELQNALSNAQPGQHIILAAGSYPGLFTLSRAGTPPAPIVVMPALGARATVANIKMNAAHNYVYGLEITGGAVGLQGIEMQCGYCGVINNFIHAVNGAVGIGAWNAGPEQIIYGNIVLGQIPNNNNPHNIYTQNDFAVNGYKWFISNVSLDPPPTGNTAVFHGYTEGNKISGLWIERNIFGFGRWLLGGFNEPHYQEVVKGNFFFRSGVQFGYRRPLWTRFENNYVALGEFNFQWQWGVGEVQFPQLQTEPTVITGNTFIQPTGIHWNLRTSAYTTAGRQEGVPALRSQDVSDDNRFVSNDGLFHGVFYAGGILHADVDGLVDWRNYSAAAGKRFDENSTQESFQTSDEQKQFYLQNEYDSSRGHLAVYNWAGLPAVNFSLPGKFAVHKIRDPFGPAIVTGTDSASIPLGGQFEVFLIKALEEVCDIEKILELANEIMSIRLDPTLTPQQKVRRMGRLNLQIIDEAEKCQE